jgi:hypothetical protein
MRAVVLTLRQSARQIIAGRRSEVLQNRLNRQNDQNGHAQPHSSGMKRRKSDVRHSPAASLQTNLTPSRPT